VLILATSGQTFTDPTIYTGVFNGFNGRYDGPFYFSQVKQISRFWHDCTASTNDNPMQGYCTCAPRRAEAWPRGRAQAGGGGSSYA
jgi:hypothetical protein